MAFATLCIQHLQYIANDAHAPHVRVVANNIKVDDLRSRKFRCPEQHLQLLLWIVVSGQAKVNDLDSVSGLRQAKYILRLQIEMQNILRMYKGNSLAYLLHENRARLLGQRKLIVDDTFE